MQTAKETKAADSKVTIRTIRDKGEKVIIIERKQEPMRVNGIDV